MPETTTPASDTTNISADLKYNMEFTIALKLDLKRVSESVSQYLVLV